MRHAFTQAGLKRAIGIVASCVVIALTFLTLRHHVQDLTLARVIQALRSVPMVRVELALLAVAISFLALAAYDVYAVRRVVPGRVSVMRAGFAGAAGNAVSNTLGFHIFTGGALRYRIYSRSGISVGDIGRIMGFAFVGLVLGYVGTIAVALWLSPERVIPAILFTLAIAGLLYIKRKPRQITIAGWTMLFPDSGTAFFMMVLGTLEMTAAGCALYILLPEAGAPAFFTFILIYMGAIILGVISHVPGGMGVFEATLLTAFPEMDRSQMVAVLLLYRGIYTLLPFALACAAMGIFEWRMRGYESVKLPK